jgi:(S)-2-hydroxyglutarate dehydrogenase
VNSRSSQFDIVVIGAGIVGLATALNLVQHFPRLQILVLEKEDEIAAHQSSHNSGVIHSGIYYKPGSLKARLCVEGAQRMVAFCKDHGVPYRLCGKVIVASSDAELPVLEDLHRRGQANGVSGVKMIGKEELRELEPHAVALRVPETGITDYKSVSRKYSELLVAAGGEVRTQSGVTGFHRKNGVTTVETVSGELSTRFVVNCAGLQSDRIARMAGAAAQVRIIPFRGEYYDIAPERHALVKTLIYPVPDVRFPFLGVHFTTKVGGGVEAGPNAVLSLKREGYRKTDFSFADTASTLSFAGFWKMAAKYWRAGLDEMYRSWRKRAFVEALQRLVPEIDESDLHPGGAGVRAQAVASDGRLVDDFQFVFTDSMVHVCNVPSPAATASLAIGREIATSVAERFSLNR